MSEDNSSFVFVYGQAYLIKSETSVGGKRRLELTKYYGKAEVPKMGNLRPGLRLDFDDFGDFDPEDNNPVVTVTEEAPVSAAPARAVEYTPPADVKTMKVYRLSRGDESAPGAHWYVNKSLTKQLNEDLFEGEGRFVEYNVPTTKSGLIHFLNEVCG